MINCVLYIEPARSFSIPTTPDMEWILGTRKDLHSETWSERRKERGLESNHWLISRNVRKRRRRRTNRWASWKRRRGWYPNTERLSHQLARWRTDRETPIDVNENVICSEIRMSPCWNQHGRRKRFTNLCSGNLKAKEEMIEDENRRITWDLKLSPGNVGEELNYGICVSEREMILP